MHIIFTDEQLAFLRAILERRMGTVPELVPAFTALLDAQQRRAPSSTPTSARMND